MAYSPQPAGKDPGRALAHLGRSWGWVLTFGILTLLAGVAVLAWPGLTLVLIALIVGVQVLVAGVFQFVRAFATHGMEGGARVLLGVLAVLSILVGLLLLRSPFATVAILVLILGLYWVVNGVIETFHGFADRLLPRRGLVITTGVLSVIAGLVMLTYPIGGAVTLAWVFGIWLAMYGLIEIGSAFAMRRVDVKASVPPTTGRAAPA